MLVGLLGALGVIYPLRLPSSDPSKKLIGFLGCATLMAYGGLTGFMYYVVLEAVAVFACLLAYWNLRQSASWIKGLLVVIAGIVGTAFLFTERHITNEREWIGAISLLAISVAFATFNNWWFLIGGIGIMIVSFWNFGVSLERRDGTLTFAATPLVFGFLNIFFAWGSFQALRREKKASATSLRLST
jgi:chromate transport protein ChrA